MKIIILILTLLLSSCAQSRMTSPHVDEELVPYAYEFRNFLDNPNKLITLNNTTIKFGNLKQDNTKDGYRTIGYCSNMFIIDPEVTIDIEYWRKASELSKQFTVYHELGHCVCNLFHTQEEPERSIWDWFKNLLFKIGIVEKKGFLHDGCPESLMYPYDISERCMSDHYIYYIEELKRSCR